MKMSADEIQRIITDGRFDDLIGLEETRCFETKSAPYPLQNEYGKLELAKDVSAMANGGGGVILVGARTEKDLISQTDIVRSVSPFPIGLIDTSQYRNILATWIYPQMLDVTINWLPSVGDKNLGVVSITVPEAGESRRPIIVTKTPSAPGEKKRELLIGYVTRVGSDSIPSTPADLHRLLRNGIQAEAKEDLFTRIRDVHAGLYVPTDEELNAYKACYSNPFVIHIRKAFENYLRGSDEGMDSPEVTRPMLNEFRDYLASPFVVMAIERGLGGGYTINLVFQNRPDAMFMAWVYRLSGGEYSLRGFGKSKIPESDFREICHRYKRALESRELRM